MQNCIVRIRQDSMKIFILTKNVMHICVNLHGLGLKATFSLFIRIILSLILTDPLSSLLIKIGLTRTDEF